MVRDIVTYPDKRINIISPDLRLFDDDLRSVIQDLKDTMNAHNTNAMAAIQIAIPMSLIVIKEQDGTYQEIINPRIISKSGLIDSKEKTLYFPNTTQNVKRYEKIKLIYQNQKGEQKSLDAQGDKAVTLQRKIDYVYGATLANRLDKTKRKGFEKVLSKDGIQGSFESCPTISKRDYFISFIQKILFLTAFFNIISFFVSTSTLSSFYTFAKYGFFVTLLLLIGYFFVAYYESKKQNSCTSCQVGNIIGTTVKYTVASTLLFILSSYLLRV